MRKIPLFRSGGWLNSYDGAFNQPSSYVGLKYINKDPDLPPLEGMKKYLEDDQKLRKEHEAYQKAGSPDDDAFRKILGENAGKSTTGQLDEVSNEYNKWRQEFHNNFQGDAVFSDEARSALAQINSRFGPALFNRLQQNKQILDDQLKLIKDNGVDGDVWTDGNHVIVQDMETGVTDVAKISAYSNAKNDPKTSQRYRVLNNRQAYDWKDKNWSKDSADNFILGDQWSLEKTSKYIDDFFKGAGHNSGGGTQDNFVNIKSFLEGQGIDVNTGNVIQQVSSKWKNNNEQLAYVQQRIYDSLPSSAKNSFIAHLVSEGVDPFAKTTIKGTDGQEMEVTNASQYMSRAVSSATGKHRIQEQETGFGFRSMGSGIGDTEIPDQDVVSLFLNLGEKFPGAKTRQIPSLDGDGLLTEAWSIRADHPEIAETFGISNEARSVTGGKIIKVEGHDIMVGDDFNEGKGNTYVHFVELPGLDNIVVTYKEVMGEDGKVKEIPVYLLERTGVTNMTGLQAISDRIEGKGGEAIYEKGIQSGTPLNKGKGIITNLTRGNIKKKYGIPDDNKTLEAFSSTSNLHVISYFEEISEPMSRIGARKSPTDKSILNTMTRGIYGGMSKEQSENLAGDIANEY